MEGKQKYKYCKCTDSNEKCNVFKINSLQFQIKIFSDIIYCLKERIKTEN